VDEQTRGPFAHWRHAHELAQDPGGGTTMIDTVEFSSPYRLLGTAVDRVVLTRYLYRLIAVRNEGPKETLERAS
jgi:ligand-binding SRPBCC domain-containing protein